MGKVVLGLIVGGYLLMAMVSRGGCRTTDDIVNGRPNPAEWWTGLIWPVNLARQEDGLDFWGQISQCPVDRRSTSETT